MIIAKHICKNFNNDQVKVLKDINFEIADGEFVSITGRSGSGKSTLLYIVSTLDMPSSGELIIDQQSITELSSDELHEFRNTQMGFVFQFHYLLPELNAIDNVLLPARKSQQHLKLKSRAKELLGEFGLEDKASNMPSELSGGEHQRVAIARALIMQPKYLFADEPTGNLDSHNGNKVMDIFNLINKEMGTSVVFVTHDQLFAERAGRRFNLVDGRLG